jgi:hypothetical protein
MATSPPGGQYPRAPRYNPYPQPAVARLPQPNAMRRAMFLMYAGAVAGLASGIVSGLTMHNVTFYTYSAKSANSATVHGESSLAVGIVGGLIVAGLWLWMTWKTGAGRGWARVLSSVFFGFMCLELIGSTASVAGSGGRVTAFVLVLAEWGVGLAALIQLWQRESSQFFALAKQAKLARAYPGYQPPGYGQPPSYGQPEYRDPGYGQPPQDGQ